MILSILGQPLSAAATPTDRIGLARLNPNRPFGRRIRATSATFPNGSANVVAP